MSTVTAPQPPALSLRGAGYGDRLHPTDLELGSGALALIGANGAGKSTLLNLLTGGLKAPRGTVKVFGHGPRSAEASRLRAYVPQRIQFPPHLHVSEILAAAVQAKRCPTTLAHDAVARMGLGGVLTHRVGTLSGGMTQRLALAAALMDEPPLWLLDEPASAIDEDGLSRLAEWAREHGAAGGTLVVSAHRPEEVEALAGEALLLSAGRVIGRLKVADLFEYEVMRDGQPAGPLPAGWRVRRMAGSKVGELLAAKDGP